MELKRKWKRFWTLTRHRDGGFTLVELVVVIAILAILAGVAVPAYNGYIEKSKTAADQQLLAAVNKAFAAACMEAKVDAVNVTEAHISMMDQQVYGLSKVRSTVTETSGDAEANFATIASAFTRYYTESNENAVFKTEGINSLQWENGAFVMKTDYVDTVITMSNGKSVVVSAEDMALIQVSTFADMGYESVKTIVNNAGESGELLASVLGMSGMTTKLTTVMVANGLISSQQAEDFAEDLSLKNSIMNKAGFVEAAGQAGNGLQMVTAKYLASGNADTDYLLNMEMGSTLSVAGKILDGESGTKIVSAVALQYAMAQSFANSSASEGTTVTYNAGTSWKPNKVTVSVSEFLASDYAVDDPIKAMAMVQATDGYKTYKTTDQYISDVNGFVGTMSLLGDNLGAINADGTIKTDGAIAPGDYLTGGIDSDAAKEVLTEVLGE